VTKGLEYRRRSHEILESMDGGKYDVREADEIRDLGEYDTLLFKTASAAGSSFLAGTILGAITAAWQDVPAVERNVALPALKKTGRIMMNYGLTFGAIGGIFAVTESVAGSIRGEKDFWNSALGGAAAGSVLGIRAGKLPVGIGAAAALAAVAVIVDAGGQRVRTPTGREYLPFPRQNPDL
jgi:import inner membrane translocase subunit TIM22